MFVKCQLLYEAAIRSRNVDQPTPGEGVQYRDELDSEMHRLKSLKICFSTLHSFVCQTRSDAYLRHPQCPVSYLWLCMHLANCALLLLATFCLFCVMYVPTQ